MREHYAAYRRQRGRRHVEDVEGRPLPEAVAHVWQWYLELDRGRRGGEALCWADVDAWARMTGVQPTYPEVSLLFEIERIAAGLTRK